MKLLYLDLELNQPSQKIVQVGYVIGDPASGYCHDDGSDYVRIDEPLDKFVADLTGIEQKVLDNKGVSLLDAYTKMLTYFKKHECENVCVTWGGADNNWFKNQVKSAYPWVEDWPLATNHLDVKNLYMTWKLANDKETLSGGLARAMVNMKLKFSGRKHNARDDAYNTFMIHKELTKRLRD